MTVRPCFLMLDRVQSGALSTRKLVIESIKFNAITAYTAAEALATLERFPEVDGVVVDASLPEPSIDEITSEIRKRYPDLLIIVTGSAHDGEPGPANYVIETYSPERLLNLLRELFPQESASVTEEEEA